jgi:hypothetical protein
MPMNPLVAEPIDEPVSAWSGVWIAEDIEQIGHGVRSGSWVDGSLGLVSAGLDGLALVSDPIGTLLQYGVSWLIEHVRPLSQALDWLAGDPALIAAQAQTWRNAAASLRDESDELALAVRRDLTEWSGGASQAYRRWADARVRSLLALGSASDITASIVEGAGALVGTVRIMVRDAIATVVSRLAVYAAELVGSVGLATPLVVEQVSTLCASWAARIARWLRALIDSLRRLGEAVHVLVSRISDLEGLLGKSTPSTPANVEMNIRQAGGELRRPRNALDFEISWAEQAYDRIRATDDVGTVSRTAARFGFSEDDIRGIKNHVFYDEHLLDLYPGEGTTMRRFDSNPRMAEAWLRLADGNPHPSDIDWLSHERFEAKLMAETGDPSYLRAHTATNRAGFTWDSERAASDGVGYSR